MKVTQWASGRRAAARERRGSADRRTGFGAWYRSHPSIGGVLTILAGVEMFFSGQLDIGKIHVQVGIEGLQATIIPIILVVLGILVLAMPVHRIFYGVISLVVSVYSLIGVNLGGFFVGMLLGAVGGILVVSWMPKKVAKTTGGDGPTDAGMRLDESSAEPRPLVRSRR